MKSPARHLQAGTSDGDKTAAIQASVPPLVPFDHYDSENGKSEENALENPPNPVMLDGIWQKRFFPSLTTSCMKFLARADQALKAKLRSLFDRV